MADVFDYVFMLILFGSFTIVGLGFIDCFYYEEHTVFNDIYLRSLQDGSSIHGSFSLGSGTIREEPQFVYYAIDGDGYVLRSVPAENSKIIEDENNKPFLREYTLLRVGRITGWQLYHENRYEFHVPKETIIQQWNLDGQLR